MELRTISRDKVRFRAFLQRLDAGPFQTYGDLCNFVEECLQDQEWRRNQENSYHATQSVWGD